MQLKTLFLSIFLLLAYSRVNTLAAQDGGVQSLPQVPKGSVADKIKDRSFDDTQVLLKQEFTGGAMIHTRGFGLLLRRAKNKTFLRKRLFELEAVSMEHPKEVKSVNPFYENSNSYNYGELNQVVVTRLGYGRHNVLYAKFDKGVEIRYLYIGGFSMAWAKPIYLEIGYPSIPYEYVATERYDPNKTDSDGNLLHTQDNIFGRASIFKGIENMQFYPGIYGKFGFSFEYARKQKNVRSLEAGIIIDYYIQDVPMMALIDNDPYYLTFYLAVNFGLKWYR
ncbi:MAG: hypothetical protein ACI9UR_000692 [Bacteroidia bacterium]|jgi:hypothetical protein